MLNTIWLGMIITAIVFAFINDTTAEVAAAVTTSAKLGFELCLGLAGIIAFWLGLMRIAEEAGLIKALAHRMQPLLRYLFPDIPDDHPALAAIVLNMAANMLGLDNAATPFGLKAMQALESLNPYPGIASNSMCTFLAVNTSSVQLIPVVSIAYLSAGGAHNPTAIISATLLATICSTIAAIIAVKCFERLPCFAIKQTPIPLAHPSEEAVHGNG